MLLVLTNSADATADYLCQRLEARKLAYVRLNTDQCLEQVTIRFTPNKPTIKIGSLELACSDVNNIWLRRPGKIYIPASIDDAEKNHIAAEWAEAINGFLAHIPQSRWVNHPIFNATASHKLEQLSRAQRLGFTIPATLVTQNPDDFKSFLEAHAGEVIAKPLASGYIERSNGRDSVIYTSAITDHDQDTLLLLHACPTLLQSKIKKVLDVRVCVLDNDLIAAAILTDDGTGAPLLDVRANNMSSARYHQINLPKSIERRLTKLVRSYKLRFAAIDLALSQDDEWVFFEINPNGQWAWLDLTGGLDVANLFVRSLYDN